MLGLIGKKIGMTQVFDDSGELMPVTVIKVEPNLVVGQRTADRNGYSAVVLGAINAKASRLTKPVLGQYAKNDLDPKKYLVEMRDFDHDCKIGDSLGVELLENSAFVDVVGTSKGKGFQGVMKRHGFGGGRKTHGSKFHRGNGSTGMAAYPSRVIKGTKMPGRMGGEQCTSQNLRVVRIDAERQMILVHGAVPGTKDGYVIVQRAKKKG
ncbi:MAG: 50S ribosomal protein L3 [Spirochaetales bacterium]|nr:MAG: 50S ribosomal protein L3 [Spirochaetales bacterium]